MPTFEANGMSILPGDRVTFQCSSMGDRLYAYDGQDATVVRQLEWDTEADREVGRMFRLRLDDGVEIDAFEDELTSPFEESR